MRLSYGTIGNYMFKKENILTKVKVGNWTEAIRIAGGLLESSGSITSKYTDAMIDAVKEMGPYMVILPHFALAHAAPSKEVLKDDFALVTLEEPVLFGVPNDPVYIILALCAKDGKSHMDSLAKIAKVLMEENTIQEMIEAKTPQEILDITEKHLL